MLKYILWTVIIGSLIGILGLIGWSNVPNYTAKSLQKHQFVINKNYKLVLANLTTNNILEKAAEMNGGKILYEENIIKNLDIHKLKIRNPEFDLSKSDKVGVKVGSSIFHLRSDLEASQNRIKNAIYLVEPETVIGVRDYQLLVEVAPNGNQTQITISVYVAVTRKCPESFQEYLDGLVKKSVTDQVVMTEQLFREITR